MKHSVDDFASNRYDVNVFCVCENNSGHYELMHILSKGLRHFMPVGLIIFQKHSTPEILHNS